MFGASKKEERKLLEFNLFPAGYVNILTCNKTSRSMKVCPVIQRIKRERRKRKEAEEAIEDELQLNTRKRPDYFLFFYYYYYYSAVRAIVRKHTHARDS